MKLTSPRREVVLPGYSCPSVFAAVVNAGLTPILCDLSPNSFQLSLSDLQKKVGPRTLAVVVVHLFGLPDRIATIKKIAAPDGIMILEDAAQALGSSIDSTGHFQTGEIGDLSVFSFGQGKPFSLLSGGAVIVNNPDLNEAVAKIFDTLKAPSGLPATPLHVAKLTAYAFLFHPLLFWIPQSLPFLNIGKTVFTLDLDYEKMQPLTLRLGQIMMDQVEILRTCRMNLARRYANLLKGISKHLAYIPSVNSEVHLLRFPLIFKNEGDRDACLEALIRAKLGASGSYPCPLNGFEAALQYLPVHTNLENALDISRKVLTLPLHPYVRTCDAVRVSQIIHNRLSN